MSKPSKIALLDGGADVGARVAPMAAANELLAALKGILSVRDFTCTDSTWVGAWADAEAAVAKAEGAL